MTPDAMIKVIRHDDFRGGTERLEYIWQGGTVVKVTDMLLSQVGIVTEPGHRLKPGETVSIGPFRLRVLDFDIERRDYTFTKTGFKGTVRYAIYHLTKHLDFIYRRLVLTCAVWGLARYDDYSIPTWRDIYFLDWLFKSSK